jgi:hypothetical protein
MDIFSLSKMLHHKVSDLRIRVSAIATASNPSCSSLEATPASNPSDNSSMSSIPSSYVSFQRFSLTEGGVSP